MDTVYVVCLETTDIGLRAILTLSFSAHRNTSFVVALKKVDWQKLFRQDVR
jgi:hypothetical protein